MPLTNNQYDSIKRNYDRQQSENHQILQARREAICKQSPRFAKIDELIANLSISQAEKLLSGDTEALADLKSEIKKLSQEQEAILADLGYSPDYLTQHYRCPDCKDTGYVNGKKCHCFTQAAIDMIYTQSNIKNVLEVENFQHFNYDLFSRTEVDPVTGLTPYDNIKAAVKECKYFIDHFEDEFGNLLFYGGTGVGKTFLANCIAKELLDRNHSVIYFSAAQLFEIFRKNAYEKSPEVAEDYQNIFNCEVLVIDDLGTEVPNSYTAAQLFMCLNERIMRKRSTIISTNLNLSELMENYSERTLSRISQNFTFIKLIGEDLRMMI